MKKLILIVTVASISAIIGLAQARPIEKAQYLINYDGYAQVNEKKVHADTLIVVNNTSSFTDMLVWLEVFDMKGNMVNECGIFNYEMNYNISSPTLIPKNGYGWITLGWILIDKRRNTNLYFDKGWAEKFHFRISAKHIEPKQGRFPTVEIKQVIYEKPVEGPEKMIWNPDPKANLIKCISETALGGNPNATGAIRK